MLPSEEFEGGNTAPLRARIAELEADLVDSRRSVSRLTRTCNGLITRRDDLLIANNRLLERARRAERRERLIYFVAPFSAGMVFGTMALLIWGAA